MKTIAFALLLSLAAPLSALAEDAASAAADPTLAPHSCVKPDLPTPTSSSDSDASRLKRKSSSSDFPAKFEVYRTCMKAYVDTQGELSKKHIAAANGAVNELNAFVAQVNEAQAK